MPDLRTYALGEGIVLVGASPDSLVILNSSAGMIWNRLAEGHQAAAVAAGLASHFNIPLERAAKDVEQVFRLWNSNETSAFAHYAQRPQIPWTDGDSAADLEHDRQPVSCRVYRLSDIPFCIRFHSAETEEMLQFALGHMEVPPAVAPRHDFEVLIEGASYVLRKDGIEAGRENAPHSIRHRLLYEIARISYPDLEWLIFMHGGAVGDEECCAVLPGTTGCGKSTLTAALMQSGFRYVAEDIVALSRNSLRVAPVPTRLCLRAGGWSALCAEFPGLYSPLVTRRWGREVRYLTPPPDGAAATHGLPVHCVIFPEFVQGEATQPVRISAEETLARLIQTGAWFTDSLDETLIGELIRWIHATPGYQLKYGRLSEAVSSIRELLRQ